MARKVFISFLGASNYGACHYCINDFVSDEVRFVQEATLDYLCQSGTWTKKDVAYILMTKDSKKKNWLADGQRDFKTKRIIKQPGLYACLRKRNFPMAIKPCVGLPDGNTEDEVMTIFQTVFDLLKQGDELYFDITHGFRYLPMLIVVLGNYSKFLKDVSVKMISYGNYEGRDRKTNRARIMDLTVLSTLQDWASAAAAFIRNGDASLLKRLTTSTLTPILRDRTRDDLQSAQTLNVLVRNLEIATTEMLTCRGLNIEDARTIKQVKGHLNSLEEVTIKPLKPIIDRVRDEFVNFNENPDVLNGFHAVEWCINHGLYQQATTILQESVVSFFCNRYKDLVRCDHLEDSREIMTKVLRRFNQHDEIIVLNKPENMPKLQQVIAAFEHDRELFMVKVQGGKREHISVIYRNLSELRNDINHNGMRNNPLKPQSIKIKTEEFYHRIVACLSAQSQH